MSTTAVPRIANAGESAREGVRFTSRQHVPALDGLRGVAILTVMLHHFVMWPAHAFEIPLVAIASCGWIGVDLFFALSGFLITGILIDMRGAPGYARTFYARRALRIVPLYLVTVFILTLVFRLDDVKWWYWTHTTNIMIAMAGRWNVTQIYTTHLWSLAVEEQFYLIWPLLVAICSPRRLGCVCLVIAAGGALLRILLLALGASPIAIYTMMPTHMDGLALGGALAVMRRNTATWDRLRPWARTIGNIPAPRWGTVMVAGFLVMLALDRSADKEAAAMQMLGFPLIALAGVGLIAAALEASSDAPLARWLSSPTLRAFGRYSYCLYIVHYPLVYFLERISPQIRKLFDVGSSELLAQIVLIAIGGVVSFAIAWLSYRLLELPFLRLKRYFPVSTATITVSTPHGGGSAA